MSKQTLPDLPYDYNALEPVISAKIMRLHHQMHHQAYVNNFNTAQEKYHAAEQKGDLEAMIALQKQMRFNGGGHVNHSIFWHNLAPVNQGGGVLHNGPLSEAIVKKYGSLEKFIEKFNALALGLQGSGWVWLGFNPATGNIKIVPCSNQDPLSTEGLLPLLGIDVWEHAYYLDYENRRAEYLKNIWKIVNWKNVEERFLKARI